MENDDSRTRAGGHSGRTSGPSCEGAAEQPSPPTPTPTSPLSTSGSPAQLSATRRKLQRHGRICRTQKFRRLTRGASPIFRPDAPPLHRRDGERRLSHLRTIAGQQRKTRRVQYAKSWQCETGTSAGELRAEPRAMRLVNHPFRLDSQRLLSYLTSMRVLTLAVTPAISTTFWNTIYFYTASATAGNLSYDCARGRHCTVSAAASRRHVDAFLDLFARKSPRNWHRDHPVAHHLAHPDPGRVFSS